MNAPSPEKLKVVKDLPRHEIVFAAGAEPGTGQIYLRRLRLQGLRRRPGRGEARGAGAGRPRELRDRPRAGRHDPRLRRLRRPADLVGRRVRARRVRAVEAHRKWIRDVAATPDGKVVASVADDMVCRLWDAATGRLIHELRGHEEKTPHHFPSMLFACAISPDGRLLATGDKVGHVVVWEVEPAGTARRARGARSCTPGTRSSGGTRSAASARWPSRPTGRGSPSAASARSATSTTSTARPGSRSSTGGRANGSASSPAKAAGLVEHLEFHPRRRLAARRRRLHRRVPPLLRPRRQESPRADQSPDVRP